MTILQNESIRTAVESPKPPSFVGEMNLQLQQLSPEREILFGSHSFTQNIEDGDITFTPTESTKRKIEKLGRSQYQRAVSEAANKMDWGKLKEIKDDGSISFDFQMTPVRKR